VAKVVDGLHVSHEEAGLDGPDADDDVARTSQDVDGAVADKTGPRWTTKLARNVGT
jgi:hypothetical protein